MLLRRTFAVVGLALLSLALAACAPDNGLGPVVGTTLPSVGEPCFPGSGNPEYIGRAGCHACLNDALQCLGAAPSAHWVCISPSVGQCIPIPPPIDAGSADVVADGSDDASTDDAATDASDGGASDASTDANRDASDSSSDGGPSCDVSTDGGDAGALCPGSSCSNGVGACIRYGVIAVMSGRPVCVSNPPGRPSPERCNYIDDDCDGARDEGCLCSVDAQYACYTGRQGTLNVGICRAGFRLCSHDGMSFGRCEDEILPDTNGEICNNALDDDCDGVTDEADCFTPTP